MEDVMQTATKNKMSDKKNLSPVSNPPEFKCSRVSQPGVASAPGSFASKTAGRRFNADERSTQKTDSQLELDLQAGLAQSVEQLFRKQQVERSNRSASLPLSNGSVTYVDASDYSVVSQLGFFKNENDAALAYNTKAKELFGSFALLNEVPNV